MFTKKIISSVLVGVFLLIISCRNEDGANYNNKEDFSINLKTYLKKTEENSDKMVLLMSNVKNKNLSLELYNAKSESELKVILRNNGVERVDEFINLLKKQQLSQNEFINNNKEFYNSFNEQERTNIVNKEIAKIYEVSTSSTSRSCAEQYKIDWQRNDRNYALCLGGAIATAWTSGGVGGLIVGAGCVAMKHFGEQDAIEDYKDCLKG